MRTGKEFNPPLHGRPRQGLPAMLLRIDITVPAGQITGREDMKKNIPFAGDKADRSR